MRFSQLCFSLLSVLAIASATRSAHAAGPSDSQSNVQVGPGFLVGSGSAQPGVGLTLATRITKKLPIYLGLDTGMFFGFSPGFSVGIPIIPMAYYRFLINAEIIPTVGMGMGALMSFGSTTTANFVFLINPGIQIHFDQNMDLFFRASFGAIGSGFSFYPEFGAIFRL